MCISPLVSFHGYSIIAAYFLCKHRCQWKFTKILKIYLCRIKSVGKIEDDLLSETPDYNPDYIAQFDFLLEFDPEYTAAGKTTHVDQTVELDGQTALISMMQNI